MKKIFLSLITFLLIATVACKDDDDDCMICEVCEECEDVVGYKNYTVDFYSTHKNFVVNPVAFGTLTEQVLVKPAHLEGAFFETVTETILVKESYTIHTILDSTIIHIVANSEKDSVAEIACYHFFEEADFVQTIVPAEYNTRTFYVEVQEGTGAEIPATYSTKLLRTVQSESEIIATGEEQLFKRIVFRIPEDRSIQSYLSDQFTQQSILQCTEGDSFIIHE